MGIELAISPQMIIAFLVIGIGILAYALEWASLELTSIAIIGALMLLYYLYPVMAVDGSVNLLAPETILSGFAHPALLTVLALLVLGQGLYQSGALEGPAHRLMVLSKGRPRIVIAVSLIIVMVVSAFMNNTPVVVMFIPIMSALADRLQRSKSKVMIPLSYIAVLGGMTTLIGSSTNLLVAGTAQSLGQPSIGFFEFVIPGGLLALVGALYVGFILPKILPDRASTSRELIGADGKQFIAQIEITRDHPLRGKSTVAGMFKALPDMTVRMIQRREQAILPPFDDVTLLTGDILILAATRKALESVLSSNPDMLGGVVEEAASLTQTSILVDEEDEDQNRRNEERIVAEVVIAPASRLIGRTLEMIGMRYQTGTIVLGVQRRSRMYRTNMNDIRLEAGDVLLLLGKRSNIRGLRGNKDLLLLEWSTSALPSHELSRRAMLIFGGVVVSAASGLVPIVVASIIGAGLMIATGCLNIRQASRAIDRRIFLIVAAALAMGTALDATGGASFLAHGMADLLEGMPLGVILSAFFLLIAIMTNLLSNNATAVLFTPIAISIAETLQVDPRMFIFAVIFAANCSFATPMAYQTNLLVMGPGHHTFADYMRGGVPLIFLLWLTYSLFAPYYYGAL